MKLEFDWVDAFTDVPFGGNGCAVVHGGAVLDASTCMAYVRETSLVECTFTGPSDCADLRIKYFLASREIPFAGHPSIATLAALRHRGWLGDGPVSFETGAGVIQAEVDGGRITLFQNAPVFGAQVPAEIVAAVGGLQAEDILGTPQIVSTGLPFCITVLRDPAALARAKLDQAGLAAYMAHLGTSASDMMEPFWVTLSGFTEAGNTSARLLLAPPSPAEDPFTGSATGAMAGYLWAQGLITSPAFIAEQGHLMGRPGQAQVEVVGPRDAITGVKVAGRGAVLMSGSVFFPD